MGLPTEAAKLPWTDPVWYAETFLWIRSKEQKIVPFRLKPLQRRYARAATRRDLVFKARQLGFSTWNLARLYHNTITNEGTNTKIVAHKREAAELLLATIKLFYERTPEWAKPEVFYNSKWQMTFPKLGSQITVTSSAGGAGRSETIHNLLATELAYWDNPEEDLPGLLEAVPQSGTVVIESTPAGVGDYFYRLVEAARAGRGPWKLHEYLWWDNPEEYSLPLDAGETIEYTDEEKRLVEAHSLTHEQIKWRRAKTAELGKVKFGQEYEGDFAQAGRPVFDVEALRKMQLATREPLPGYPSGFRIYEPFKKGHQYVIGADVAEGLATGDADAAVAIRRDTGRVVAVLHGRWTPALYAEKLNVFGHMYGRALLSVERNNHGHAVLLKLQELGYPKLTWWSGKTGWSTDARSKPLAIDRLEEAIRKGLVSISDLQTVLELQAFVHHDNGSMAATPGAHDDLVMALAIAWMTHQVAVGTGDEETVGARVIG